MIYRKHNDAAEAGNPAPKIADLSALLDCGEGGTLAKIERRMEEKGWLVIQRYQRARQVTIMATGKSTAAPSNQAPHWRQWPEHCDVTVYLLKRYPGVYATALAEARRRRISLPAYVSRIVIGDLPPIANCSQASAG